MSFDPTLRGCSLKGLTEQVNNLTAGGTESTEEMIQKMAVGQNSACHKCISLNSQQYQACTDYSSLPTRCSVIVFLLCLPKKGIQ